MLCFAVAGYTLVFYNDIAFLKKIKTIDDITYTDEVKIDDKERGGKLDEDNVVTTVAESIDWNELS